jgi:hypothetical protein
MDVLGANRLRRVVCLPGSDGRIGGPNWVAPPSAAKRQTWQRRRLSEASHERHRRVST